jgi:TRAP-type mannitol/chloroaromatic compound transport system permease small subunit
MAGIIELITWLFIHTVLAQCANAVSEKCFNISLFILLTNYAFDYFGGPLT